MPPEHSLLYFKESRCRVTYRSLPKRLSQHRFKKPKYLNTVMQHKAPFRLTVTAEAGKRRTTFIRARQTCSIMHEALGGPLWPALTPRCKGRATRHSCTGRAFDGPNPPKELQLHRPLVKRLQVHHAPLVQTLKHVSTELYSSRTAQDNIEQASKSCLAYNILSCR